MCNLFCTMCALDWYSVITDLKLIKKKLKSNIVFALKKWPESHMLARISMSVDFFKLGQYHQTNAKGHAKKHLEHFSNHTATLNHPPTPKYHYNKFSIDIYPAYASICALKCVREHFYDSNSHLKWIWIK